MALVTIPIEIVDVYVILTEAKNLQTNRSFTLLAFAEFTLTVGKRPEKR